MPALVWVDESTESDFRRGDRLRPDRRRLAGDFLSRRSPLLPALLIKPEDVPAVRMWAMNVGAYNIAFGLGIASGLWMVNFSDNAARKRL